MQTGYVRWFNSRKGCGFISPDDGGFNVRVHASAVERTGLLELKDGQKIYFEAATDERTGEIFAVKLRVPIDAPADIVGTSSEPESKWGSVRWLLAGRKARNLVDHLGVHDHSAANLTER